MKSAASLIEGLREKNGLKRASFRDACDWIAFNDDSGSPDAEKVEVVAGYISTCLVADIFGCEREKVARAVVRRRATERRSKERS